MVRTFQLAALRARVQAIEWGEARLRAGALPFGLAALDGHLPGGGLALGVLHTLTGAEDVGGAAGGNPGAAATLFLGGVLARLPGTVLWAAERCRLFPPGLACVGLDPGRLLFAEADNARTVLCLMEEGLRTPGFTAVCGELRGINAIAARRLQLAAGRLGITAFVLLGGRPVEAPPFAATHWRVSPLPQAPRTGPGLGRARWRLELLRCRGAEPASWIVEACDAAGYLGLPANVAYGPAAAQTGLARA